MQTDKTPSFLLTLNDFTVRNLAGVVCLIIEARRHAELDPYFLR